MEFFCHVEGVKETFLVAVGILTWTMPREISAICQNLAVKEYILLNLKPYFYLILNLMIQNRDKECMVVQTTL